MSGITLAELRIMFTASTEGADRGIARVRSGLTSAEADADRAARSFLNLEGTIKRVQAAFFGGETAAKAYGSALSGTTLSATELSKAFGIGAKEAKAIETAMTSASIAAKASSAELAAAGGSAGMMATEVAALRAEVQGLGRTFGSAAAANYAGKLNSGALAASVMEAKVAGLVFQVNALNGGLAATKATGFPAVGSMGSGAGGGSAIGRIGSAGRGLATNFGIPTLAIGAAATRAAMDYEASLTRIRAYAGASREEVNALSPTFLKMGETFGIQGKEIADGFFHIRSAIHDTKTATDVLTVSAKASASGLGHMEDVAKVVTSARYAFGQSAKYIGDIIAKAATLSHADPGAFFKNMGQAIPIATTLKMRLSDVAGLVAIMTREGLDPAKGFQRVTSMMDSLSAPTKKQLDVAKLIGIDYGQFRKEMQQNVGGALEEVFTKAQGNLTRIRQFFGGRRAGDAALAFFNPNAAEENIRVLHEMAQAAGTVDSAWKEASGTTRVSVAQMNVALQNAAISLGQSIAPSVVALTGDVRGLADSFASLSPSTQRAIVEGGAFVATIGVAGGTVAKVAEGAGALRGALSLASGALGVTTLASRAAAASGLALNAAFLPEIATFALIAGAAYGLYKAYQAVTDGGNSARHEALSLAQAHQHAAETKAGDARRTAILAQQYATLAAQTQNLQAHHQNATRASAQMHGLMDQIRAISLSVAHGIDAQSGSLQGLAHMANAAAQQYANLSAEARKAAVQTATTRLVNLANSRAYVQEGMDNAVPGSDVWNLYKPKLDRMNANYARLKQEQLALMHAPKVDAAHVVPVTNGGGGTGGGVGRGFDYSVPSDPGGGGRKKAAKEETDRLASSRDQAYELAKALKLGDDASKSASLAYDIAHNHLDGYADAMKDGNKAQAEAIIQAAKHALNLTYQTEKAEKARKAMADWAQSLREAREAANSASNDLARITAVGGPGDPTLNGLAWDRFKKRFDELPKSAQEALAQQAKAMKDLKAAQYDGSGVEFDNGDKLRDENLDKRAKAMADATAKYAKAYEDAMDRLADREGRASKSLAKRRAQASQDSVSGLPSTGSSILDAVGATQVGLASARNFDDRQLRAYADELGKLTREMASFGQQSDASRIASIRLADDGSERFTEDQARNILALQKQMEALRSQREQARQAGDMVGGAFSSAFGGAVEHGLNGGLSGLLRSFLASLNSSIASAVTGGFASSLSAWVQRSVMAQQSGPKGRGYYDPGITGFAGGAVSLAEEFIPIKGKRAGGGPMEHGKPYLVGEHRPEVVVPEHDSYVYPSMREYGEAMGNILSPEMMRGGGGSMGTGSSGDARAGDTHVTNHFSPSYTFHGPADRRSIEQSNRESFKLGQRAASQAS